MIIGILKLICTSILLLIGVITAKKDYKKKNNEKRKFKKYFNLINASLFFIFLLFISELIAFRDQMQKEELQEKKLTETHINVKDSHKLIDSVLNKVKLQIENTGNEIKLISELNTDIKDTRENISKNLFEYQKINLAYSQQIELEKKKILTELPEIRVDFPITLTDSVYFAGRFQLTNVGQRTADSIKFFSMMILINSDNKISRATSLKTNRNDQNILRLSPDIDYSHFVNYPICLKKDIDKYSWGYLIIKYSYFDLMTDSTIISPVQIYECSNLKDVNKHYAFNVPETAVKLIKDYLKKNNKEAFELFW